MKKMIISAICLGFACVATADIATQWGAQLTGAFLYDSTGAALDSSVGTYRIELVIDTMGNTDMTMLSSGYIGLSGDSSGWMVDATASDDLIWTADARVWLDGGGGVSYFLEDASQITDTHAGSEFYFRWFNADTEANASEAGFIYGAGGTGNLSGWTLGDPAPAPPDPAVRLDYAEADSLGSAYAPGVNDGWQTIAPVPEPGTMALFALGLATLGVSRRRRKVQA